MVSRESLFRLVDPRPLLAHLVRQFRSSLVAKANLLQLICIIYWLVLMILMKYPEHSWSFVLSGFSLIQAFGLASKPQLSTLYANSTMAVTQLTFTFSVWVFAIYWSFARAGRIDGRIECMEVYPVYLAEGQSFMALQSKIATFVISACQLCIIVCLMIQAKIDKSQDPGGQYTKVESEDQTA